MSREPANSDEYVEPGPALWTRVLPVLLIGCFGCILFGVRECRHAQATPAAPPTAVVAAAESPPPPPPPTATHPAVDPDAAAERGFKFYEHLWREGQFHAAAESIRTINSALPSRMRQDAFWARMLPTGSRTLLTLATPCNACERGQCTACAGSGQCSVCAGTRTCPECKGQPLRTERCTTCPCPICAATGQCRACRGIRLSTCPGCAGGGGAAQPHDITCVVCGGKGYREGLRRGDRPAPRQSCGACVGTGKRRVSRYETCKSCQGTGRIACAACAGKGACAACKGRGQADACRVCGGTGSLSHPCTHCEGLGKCMTCQGNGRCTTCGGRRQCPVCSGQMHVRLLSLPAHHAWLRQHGGYLHFSASGVAESGDTEPGAHLITFGTRAMTLMVAEGEVVWLANQMVTGAQAVAAMQVGPDSAR